jgi:hypothetical protein
MKAPGYAEVSVSKNDAADLYKYLMSGYEKEIGAGLC